MSLLDPNIKTIIITSIKHSLKEKWFHGKDPSWELKDHKGNLLGKLIMESKGKKHGLYNSDNSILLTLKKYGYFNVSYDILDSDGNIVVKEKNGVLENSKGEEILTTDRYGSPYGIKTFRDKKGNTVAELDFNKFEWKRAFKGEKPWTLKIHDPHFDKIMILSFVLCLVYMQSGMGGGPEGATTG